MPDVLQPSDKCAEIYFSNVEKLFSISCVQCDLITSNYKEFCDHFLNLHVQPFESDDYDGYENLNHNSKPIGLLNIKQELQGQSGKRLFKTICDDENSQESIDDFNNDCVKTLVKAEPSDRVIKVGNNLSTEWKENQTEKTYDDLSNDENGKKKFKRNSLSSWGAFECAYCDRSFSSKVNCDRHQLRHTHSRNIYCDVCNKGFYTKAELHSHMRYHKNEQLFMCEHCGKGFQHSWVLKKHSRTHNPQNRTLPCPECGKLFAYNDVLRNHLLTHNREASFTCELCNHKFTQAKLLWTHKRRHHSEKKEARKSKK